MTLFSRRTLQRLIDENASTVLTEEQSQCHIDRLNDVEEQTFSFEWEVVVLNVLNKVGRVIHEKKFGTRHPDVFFTSRTNKEESFIADIVTVSDEGLEKEEPVKAFEAELQEKIEKFGLSLNPFILHFNRMESSSFGEKPDIKVPERNRFHKDFFNNNFKSFLRRVRENPSSPEQYYVKTKDIDVCLEYNPQNRRFTMHLPANDIPYNLVKNPIYNALRGKVRKLKQAKFEGTRGIIVCDGGSAMFHFRKTGAYQLIISTEMVIREFFRQNKSVAFVLLIFIDIQGDVDAGKRRYEVKTKLYENELHEALSEDLRAKLFTLDRLFPIPVIDARSAVSNIKKFGKLDEGWGFYAKLIMDGMKEVKISARTLLGLLAGTINQQQFLEDYGFVPDKENTLPSRNPFAINLEQGKLITEINLEKSEHEDDDYIVFKFGETDAAISPFRLQPSGDSSNTEANGLLVGTWILQAQFPNNQKVNFNLTVTQDGNHIYGTLETEEGIAHLTDFNVQDKRFEFKIPSVPINEQFFDMKISGEVDSRSINAHLILSDKSGASFSFPVTGTRM
ncbi:MAG TPA: hypothetical protein VN256_15140 [Pyrinomonadaceae bacterium]|nr:hypothetical protein [Pyrinomonadaceae bacterium]